MIAATAIATNSAIQFIQCLWPRFLKSWFKRPRAAASAWNLSHHKSFSRCNNGGRKMRDDNDLDRRSAGAMGPGTIAAVIAVLAIIGAIFMWGPWSGNTNTAANPAPATTVGQS